MKEEILDKIKERLKDQEYEIIELSKTITDSILLRKILCTSTKIDGSLVPLRFNRVVNIYQFLYELDLNGDIPQWSKVVKKEVTWLVNNDYKYF